VAQQGAWIQWRWASERLPQPRCVPVLKSALVPVWVLPVLTLEVRRFASELPRTRVLMLAAPHSEREQRTRPFEFHHSPLCDGWHASADRGARQRR
jgi:hypothetical protein